MKLHLDTSIVIDIIRFKQDSLLQFELTNIQDIAISSIVSQELWAGTGIENRGPRAQARLKSLLAAIEILPFDSKAAERAGLLEAELRRKGQQIGFFDPLIAGHALSVGATLVTKNTKDFKRIPGLEIVDWSKTPD